MARKHKHEDHLNHEAWAIPYGDLITLLLAFFVVMYSMSSVNEGKYRILSDSLVAAFRGAPKTVLPIEVGTNRKGYADSRAPNPGVNSLMVGPSQQDVASRGGAGETGEGGQEGGLTSLASRIEEALQDLIEKNLVQVHRKSMWVEIEIRTDILFPSGVADISDSARPALLELAAILADFPNLIRVEGHTDNVPIYNQQFQSNWELSSARAASVVHLFESSGVASSRLEIIGMSEFRPVAANDTEKGRNENRRVAVVVLEQLKGSSRDVSALRLEQEMSEKLPEHYDDQAREREAPGVPSLLARPEVH